LYASGFKDPASRLELANVIRFNLLEGARATVTASFDEAISGGGLVASDSLSAAALLNKLPEGCTTLDDATAGAIKTLWKDAAFQKTLSNSSKFQLQECVVPFLQECQEYPAWGGAKWVPSIDDCVRSRIRSSGIIEVEFEYEGVKFKVLDAGGQRAERRKWIHAFEDVTALIFVASLTEYDETLYEDHSKNRLQESLEVWGDVTNNAAFVATPVLLFLNKMDLFVEKYVRRGTPLNASGCFPGAPAYTPNFPLAIEWIKEQFKSRRTKSDPSLLYIHTTTVGRARGGSKGGAAGPV
jgi:hypothetical protein